MDNINTDARLQGIHTNFKIHVNENRPPTAIRPGSHSDSTEKSKLYRQAKAKRIQYHQTSSTTNAKGTFLSGKHKRRKGPTKTNPKQLRKW